MMVVLEPPDQWDPKVTLGSLEQEPPVQKETQASQEILVCPVDLEAPAPQERMVSPEQTVLLVLLELKG